MAQFAFVTELCEFFRINGSPSSCKTVIRVRLFDNATGEESFSSLDVEVFDTDNATQIEVNIREAVLAEALNRGFLDITTNRVIQPALRRG